MADAEEAEEDVVIWEELNLQSHRTLLKLSFTIELPHPAHQGHLIFITGPWVDRSSTTSDLQCNNSKTVDI
uniref:Uncharacterized protein n=1 Tax=Salix viminalis TaxID=40686 RepID=A0A6N2LVM4_SALVM